MRKIFLLFCLVVPSLCRGGVLHVGNLEFQTFSTQQTEHAIFIRRENGVVENVPLFKKWYDGTVHVALSDGIYSACNTNFYRDGHYYFCGNDLVAADDNVYLESTGEQYIDTGVTELLGTRPFLIETIATTTDNSVDSFGVIFGNKPSLSSSQGFSIFLKHSVKNRILYARNAERYVLASDFYDGLFHKVDTTYDGNGNGAIAVDGNIYALTSVSTENVDNTGTYYLFATNGWRVPTNTPVNFFIGKTKGIRIVANGIERFYFIPVPAGLQIGNFTVPENGMWDIVEQKFYGNSGTGEFIYGVDE